MTRLKRAERRRARLGRVPAWPHAPGCECEGHETFTCERCGKRYGWCLGASDNMPEACDFCWKPSKDVKP